MITSVSDGSRRGSAGLVPLRLLAPEELGEASPPRRPPRRLGAVFLALALAAVGAVSFVGRPSRGVVVVSEGHVRVAPADRPDHGVEPFQGAGAWVDTWDYAPSYQRSGGGPAVTPADVAAMAATGVRTLYLQTAGVTRTAGATEEPGLLGRFLAAAHSRGMRVVGWYAPSLADPTDDLARLVAVAGFPPGAERFDGLAVAVDVNPAIAGGRQRLLSLSRRLRAQVGPGFPLAVIVPPPAALDGGGSPFPWRALATVYDAWIPRIFWTSPGGAGTGSGGADPAAITRQTIDHLRERVGDPHAAVHPLGGLGGAATEADVRAFLAAAAESGAIGASIYDFRSTPAGISSEVGAASASGPGSRDLSE
jgi:hypothetical protein